MTLESLYRRARRWLGVVVLMAILVVLALRLVIDDAEPGPLTAGFVVVGAAAALLVVSRSRANPRLDVSCFFLMAATSAAHSGDSTLPSLAVPFGIFAVLGALVGCVVATLVLAERSLNTARSRF